MSLDSAVRRFLILWDKAEGGISAAVEELRKSLPEIALHRAIYTSRALINASGDTDLLIQCVELNAIHGITGVLMRHEDYYIHILEGSRVNVSKLLDNIRKDPRHTDFLLVQSTPIDARTFDEWTMASETISPQEYAMWRATFAAGERYIDRLVSSFFEGRYRK